MSALIRPSLHAITLAMLVCACLLVAQTVNTVVSVSLRSLPTADRAPQQEAAPVPAVTAPPLSAELLARSMGLSLAQRPSPTVGSSDTTQPSRLALTLLGTMMSTTPSLSLASVYEDPTQRTRTAWVGSTLLGAEVLSIERTRVVLSNGGHVEVLDISLPQARGMTAPAPHTPPGAPTGFGATIRQTGTESYAIQRQDVESTLANLSQVAMQARVVPAFHEGVPQGFKLFAMKPDSIYARLGMLNGDIVRRVNGFTLDDPMRAMEAYNHLKNASRIDLELERDGQPLRKTFTVEN
jgi:general secretion pathway protein C